MVRTFLTKKQLAGIFEYENSNQFFYSVVSEEQRIKYGITKGHCKISVNNAVELSKDLFPRISVAQLKKKIWQGIGYDKAFPEYFEEICKELKNYSTSNKETH